MHWSTPFANIQNSIEPKPHPAVGLHEAWQDYRLLRLRFRIRSLGLHLPYFHGALWHGVIGARLRELDPLAYLELWENERCGAYALHAPLGPEFIPEDELFGFELSLFGDAIRHTPSLIAAVDAATHALGMTQPNHQRGRGILEEVWQVTPNGMTPLNLHTQQEVDELGISVSAILNNIPEGASPAVRLILDYPLRLKHNGILVKQHPDFATLLRRILGRMRQLHPVNAAEDARRLLDLAKQISSHGAVRWGDLQRWSARQQQEMVFGGLIGFLEYHGHIQPFLPWLALGEWLHIGGKSTFGFGSYQLQIAEQSTARKEHPI